MDTKNKRGRGLLTSIFIIEDDMTVIVPRLSKRSINKKKVKRKNWLQSQFKDSDKPS